MTKSTRDPGTPLAGTPLASELDVRDRAQFEQSLRGRLRAAEERWGGSGRAWVAPLLGAVAAAIVALLWASDAPRLRAGTGGALIAGYIATLVLLTRPSPMGRRWAAIRPMIEDGHVFLLIGAAAATGGLHSPFLPAFLVAPPARILSSGWSQRTRAHVLVVCCAAIALAFLPPAWFGPPLPAPTYAAVAALTLITAAALTSSYIAFLSRTVEESVWDAMRAREEIAAQALARTRELEQMGARLSHELKNPLAAIKALAQLSSRAATDPDSRERLETVESEAERMRDILEEYLSFSRPLEKLRTVPVSLGALADDVLAVLAGRGETAGVALSRTGDAVAVADPRRLKEALLNLVANALEATPAGGRVGVEVSAAGGVARIAVRDSGTGMAPEVLDRLGTPYFTTREEGTGLGVLLARAIFTQHGGDLRYESAPGAGTTAVATLPATQRTAVHDEAPARR
jgi:signal transduction histidine kinase